MDTQLSFTEGQITIKVHRLHRFLDMGYRSLACLSDCVSPLQYKDTAPLSKAPTQNLRLRPLQSILCVWMVQWERNPQPISCNLLPSYLTVAHKRTLEFSNVEWGCYLIFNQPITSPPSISLLHRCLQNQNNKRITSPPSEPKQLTYYIAAFNQPISLPPSERKQTAKCIFKEDEYF